MALPTRGLILWPGFGLDGSGGGGGSADPATTTTLGTVKLSVAASNAANPIAVGTNDSRMTDARTPTGAAGGDLSGTYPNPTLGSEVVSTSTIAALAVTTAKIADAAITSAKINDGAVSATKLSTSVSNVLPSEGQKSALAGTSGTPGVSNLYVTNSDSRLSDSRTPTAHKSSHATGGSDALTPSDIGAAAASHTHTLFQVTDAGTSASRNAPASGNASANEVVLGSDTRLPTTDEKAALAGSSGSPSSTNKFVTAADARVLPTVSATIPTSPVDGQQWIFRDSTTGIAWQFIYNSSSSSSYKWEFIGGGPMVSHDTTSQTISLGTGYTGAPTSSASVTAPFAGDWVAAHEMTGTISAANLQVYMSIGLGYSPETISDNNAVFVTAHQTNAPVSTHRFDKLTLTSAGIYVVGRWKRSAATAGSVTVSRHAISLLPIRVG